MRCTVYKSLDNPASMFGLRGSYQKFFWLGAGAAAVLAILFGAVLGKIVGMVFLVAGVLGAYAAVMSVQGRLSDREVKKKLASMNLPDMLVFRPVSVRRMAESAAKRAENKGADPDAAPSFPDVESYGV